MKSLQELFDHHRVINHNGKSVKPTMYRQLPEYQSFIALKNAKRLCEDWTAPGGFYKFATTVGIKPPKSFLSYNPDEPIGPKNGQWEKPSLPKLAEMHGIKLTTLKHRIYKQDMTIEEALIV